jgi:hypothetical protein
MDHVGIFLFFYLKRIVSNASHKYVISSHQRLKLKMREKKVNRRYVIHIYDVCFKFFSTNIIVNGGR